MILSEIKTQRGFAYFVAEKRQNKTDLSLYTQRDRLPCSPHELNERDHLNGLSRLDHRNDSLLDGCHFKKRFSEYLLASPGDDTNCSDLGDLKKLRSELTNCIKYLVSIGRKVTLTPVDESRLKATLYLLKKPGFRYEVSSFIDYDGTETAIINIKRD